MAHDMKLHIWPVHWIYSRFVGGGQNNDLIVVSIKLLNNVSLGHLSHGGLYDCPVLPATLLQSELKALSDNSDFSGQE